MRNEETEHGIDRVELRREIKAEMSRQGRRRLFRSVLISIIFLVLLVLIPVIGLSALAAKTGLVQVPLLSSWLYHPSERPERTVLPLSGTTSEELLSILASRVTYDQATDRLEVSVTEEELTTLLSSSLSLEDLQSDMPLSLESIQATFENGGIMVYAQANQEMNNVPVSVLVIPSAKDGRLVLDPTDLSLGSLSIPDFVAATAFASLTRSLNDALTKNLDESGRLESVVVEDGRLNLSLSVSR